MYDFDQRSSIYEVMWARRGTVVHRVALYCLKVMLPDPSIAAVSLVAALMSPPHRRNRSSSSGQVYENSDLLADSKD